MRFKDVAAAAGVEDHGAGMSAAWLDYDNDGRLDIYTGNMWSRERPAHHRRAAASCPTRPRRCAPSTSRHARGNSLFRNRGDGTLRGRDARRRAPRSGRWAWSSDALDFDSDGWEDLYVVNGMFTRDAATASRPGRLLLAPGRRRARRSRA